ncbi:MAG: TetR/AcrR family transcriptional regulator C-terminal domain-containing protein [Spirochaetales bacterium]|nr:TetR/AcrR family transcriptional regulator C-terminal domain-containing protein [Spirochaetales bacterium]
MASKTKQVLAKTLKEIMKTSPLSKISIGDITKRCDLKRQTFYYHFTDKYHLVNWIFDREILDQIDDFLMYESWDKAMGMVFKLTEENSDFYLNALHGNFSYFYIHILQTQRAVMDNIIQELLGEKKVAQDDREFFIEFYTNAFVGTYVNWINNRMHESSEKVIERLTKIFRGTLKTSLQDYIK